MRSPGPRRAYRMSAFGQKRSLIFRIPSAPGMGHINGTNLGHQPRHPAELHAEQRHEGNEQDPVHYGQYSVNSWIGRESECHSHSQIQREYRCSG